MLRKFIKYKKKSLLFFLSLFLLMFVLDISIVLADNQFIISSSPTNTYFIDNTYQVTNITDFSVFSHAEYIFEPSDLTNELDYDLTSAIKFTEYTVALQFPNDRIGIKSPDGSFIILPENSKIESSGMVSIFHDDPIVIGVPELGTVVSGPTTIIRPPIESFAVNAEIMQSVDSLDSYKVKMSFSDLENPDLSENIVSYSVNWGDGTVVASYRPTQNDISHTYKRNGVYIQEIRVTDISGGTYTTTQEFTVEYEGHLLHTYFLVDENKGTVAATSAGIGGMALLGFILTETGKYKFLALLPLLIPMYTHIQKEDVLDQFVRGKVYGFITANPGVHYNQIIRELDMKNGTLSYHLYMLEKTDMIKSRREGVRYRAFYSTETKFPKEERYRLSELQLKILKVIKENDGPSQKEIAEKLDAKHQTISYNIKVLQQAELIDVRRIGRKTSCYIKKELPSVEN